MKYLIVIVLIFLFLIYRAPHDNIDDLNSPEVFKEAVEIGQIFSKNLYCSRHVSQISGFVSKNVYDKYNEEETISVADEYEISKDLNNKKSYYNIPYCQDDLKKSYFPEINLVRISRINNDIVATYQLYNSYGNPFKSLDGDPAFFSLVMYLNDPVDIGFIRKIFAKIFNMPIVRSITGGFSFKNWKVVEYDYNFSTAKYFNYIKNNRDEYISKVLSLKDESFDNESLKEMLDRITSDEFYEEAKKKRLDWLSRELMIQDKLIREDFIDSI